MLIEFKCSNFRSIREEQKFSLVAKNSDKTLACSIIDRELPGMSGLKYLKGAAIYGANASGKTNILDAIRYVSFFVRNSATKINPGESTGVQPFKLDKDSILLPSKFEIAFVAHDIRYLFGFSATSQRIVEEFLIAYPKGVPQRWYHRMFDNNSQMYVWAKPSTSFKQDKSLQEKTRDNSLYLSVGPQFNHPQLTKVFNWFKKNLRFLNLSAEHGLTPDFTAKQINNERHTQKLLQLLRSADIGVTDAKIQEKDLSVEEVRKYMPPALLAAMDKRNQEIPKTQIEINLVHKGEGIDPVVLDFAKEESAGTRRFFSLIGPWLDILENGYTVFVDEIETSLHPKLVKEILKLLFCDKNNLKGAQIVFTTHNTTILDNEIMRRDQVWFTEKLATGATHLYPLTDYQPRNNEALAKGYLAGRYGAVPFIPEGFEF